MYTSVNLGPKQFWEFANLTHTIKMENEKKLLAKIQHSDKFGSKNYQKTSLLNFPMTFQPNGLYDNESLKTELKKLKMKIDEQNKQNHQLKNSLENYKEKIHKNQNFLEGNRYLFESSGNQKNAQQDENQGKLESEHSTIKMLKEKVEKLRQKYNKKKEEFKELKKSGSFSSKNIYQSDIVALRKELKNFEALTVVESEIVFLNPEIF